jgi:pimeloyl-ACP methyl ester carboxylesterase
MRSIGVLHLPEGYRSTREFTLPATLRAPEEPLFFSSGGLPLYGVYHAPARPGRDAVVVHVHGLGVEQITTYRAEVLCARALAAAGHPVFRFHARGHGDSSGDFSAVTLDSMVEDACIAAEEARRRSGARRVVWLGVRFGALVAARALASAGPAAGLALWEPVYQGHDYFRGMLRALLFSQVAAGVRPDRSADQLLAEVEEKGEVDVHGYYLHRAVVRSAREAKLSETLAAWSGPTFIAQLQGRSSLAPASEGLLESLRGRGAATRSFLHREDIGWHYTQNPAWECPALVDATREWIDALA